MSSTAFEHGITYPSEYLQQDVRMLLLQSQTDQTPDPAEGLQFAAAAYDKAHEDETAVLDCTSAGEAAAQAGSRAAEMTDASLEGAQTVEAWFIASKEALDNKGPAGEREKIATFLLAGRAMTLMALKDTGPGGLVQQYTHNTAPLAFSEGDRLARKQHTFGKRWDRYGVMLSTQYAASEAIRGKFENAISIAIIGMWRAVRADDECQPPEAHHAFVQKHLQACQAIIKIGRRGSWDFSKTKHEVFGNELYNIVLPNPRLIAGVPVVVAQPQA